MTEPKKEVRAEPEINEPECVFLAVGNPRPEKAFEDLIAAAVEVQRQQSESTFSVLIAGTLSDNEYCTALRRDAEAAGVKGLRLLGYRPDVAPLYSAADAFVVSSRSEGLPMVLLEAMTAGLPIIATRVGGIPEAVPESCGRLVAPNRPGELANAMASMLRHGPERLNAMGSAAREHAVSEFGVEKMAERYISLYQEVCQRRGKARAKLWGTLRAGRNGGGQ